MQDNQYKILIKSLKGLTRFIEDRNYILKSMMAADGYQDFLLRERAQDLQAEDRGGLLSAVGSVVDLSAIPDRIIDAFSGIKIPGVEPKREPFAQGGVVGTQPIIDLSPNESGVYTASSETPSLEESGVENAIVKATSSEIEAFDVDSKLMDAFGRALALPARAAAAGLLDLMSKVPEPGEDDSGPSVKGEMVRVREAFDLPGDKKEGTDDDDKKKRKITWYEWLIEQFFGGKKKNDGGGQPLLSGSTTAGLLPTSSLVNRTSLAKGDGIPWSGRQQHGYGGGSFGYGDGFKHGIVRGDLASRSAQRGPTSGHGFANLGNFFGAGGVQNITNSKSMFGGALNFGKKMFAASPMGMAAKGIGNIWNRFRGGDTNTNIEASAQTNNLNELTQKVQSENRQKIIEGTTAATNKIQSQSPAPASAPKGASKGPTPMGQGSSEAIPKIRVSAYFDEYTVTSQF